MPLYLSRYEFTIEYSEDEKENLRRFWGECLRISRACFPSQSQHNINDGVFLSEQEEQKAREILNP